MCLGRRAWRNRLAAAGLLLGYVDPGEVLKEPLLVLEAAAHRRGIAIGFLPFVQDLIDAGRLERALSRAIASDEKYWMVLPDPQNALAPQFRSWVIEQVRALTAARATALASWDSGCFRERFAQKLCHAQGLSYPMDLAF